MHNENNFNEKINGLYSIFAFLSLLLFSCEEKLPKPTQDGKNTFGCKIDGKTWIPDGGNGFMPAKPINGGFFKVSTSDNKSYIYIRTYNKNNESVNFFIEGQTTGTYLLNEDTGFQPNQLYPKNYGYYDKNGTIYITSKKNVGKVVIDRADKNEGIISGSFEFIVGAGTSTISITNGRFDINMNTLNK